MPGHAVIRGDARGLLVCVFRTATAVAYVVPGGARVHFFC